jgi:hypothetical protein
MPARADFPHSDQTIFTTTPRAAKPPAQHLGSQPQRRIFINPLFPASDPVTGSFNGLRPKSKFLAIEAAYRGASRSQITSEKISA